MPKSKIAVLRRPEHLNRDSGYRFSDLRDPALDEICRMITDSGASTKELSDRTAKAPGGAVRISRATMDNWLAGKVNKPQGFTMMWVGLALGYVRPGWVKL